MKLSVIIVSYNVRYYLQQCLDSVVRAAHGIETDVWVVDNCSTDDSVGYLRERFPQVHFIANEENVGFARANNQAIRLSAGEYVLLLNPDTIVGEDVLSGCIRFLDEHPEAGATGTMMINRNGSFAMESRRGVPTPSTAFYKISGLCALFPSSPRFGKYYMSYLDKNQSSEIEVISGAFFMVRRQALEQVGLLSEDYFMYGEDIDLSYRITKGGYENWYVPARILHYKGESTQKSSYRYVHVFYQAMLIFFRKHYGHLSLFVTLPIRLAIYCRAFMALLSMQTQRLRRSLGMDDDKPDNVVYQFKGSSQMIEECDELARRKGLTITAHASSGPACTVYDTAHFSFSDIIRQAAADDSHPMIGTYSTDTHVLITPLEVIR